MAPFSLSLSGPDNIGKTTLLSLFPRTWPLTLVGGIHNFSEEMASMMKDGRLSDRWFGVNGTSDEDFVRLILAATRARHAVVVGKPSDRHASGALHTSTLPGFAFDRSATMFEAVSIARIATCRGISVAEAEDRLRTILQDLGDSFPTETVSLLIRRRASTSDAVEWTLRQEARSKQEPVTTKYRTYQANLHDALYRQAEAGRYTAIIEREPNETFLESLEKVTQTLQRLLGDRKTWTPLLEHVRVVAAFGGLSECGKSTVAAETVRSAMTLTSGGAFRLKIGYLLDLASSRLGKNIYDMGDNFQALELVHELDRFSRAHRWLKFITLESLHRFQSTRRLQELIGRRVPFEHNLVHVPSKYLVIYLDTPLQLRRSRTEAEGKRFDPTKDETKRERGADKIRDIADIVIANEGSFEDTCGEVMQRVGDIAGPWSA